MLIRPRLHDSLESLSRVCAPCAGLNRGGRAAVYVGCAPGGSAFSRVDEDLRERHLVRQGCRKALQIGYRQGAGARAGARARGCGRGSGLGLGFGFGFACGSVTAASASPAAREASEAPAARAKQLWSSVARSTLATLARAARVAFETLAWSCVFK